MCANSTTEWQAVHQCANDAIPKNVIEQHTRHLKNIAFDMEHRISRRRT